jgi:hypothetical protein
VALGLGGGQAEDAPGQPCWPVPANARDCVRMRFFCRGVDVALMWNADKQKPPLRAACMSLIVLGIFGCGGRI